MAAGFGYTEVLNMPWTDARDFAHAAAADCAQRASVATLQQATAMRMAQHADDAGWKKWVAAMIKAAG